MGRNAGVRSGTLAPAASFFFTPLVVGLCPRGVGEWARHEKDRVMPISSRAAQAREHDGGERRKKDASADS